MICRVKNRLRIVTVSLIFLFLISSQNFSWYSTNIINFEHRFNDPIDHLNSSFTFTFNESFQNIAFRNDTITNSSGWGKDYLSLPHQDIINLSYYNFDFNMIKSMITEDNLLFIADNLLGLKILDISNPKKPALASLFGDAYNSTFDVVVRGNYAYVADGDDGMEVIDISDPYSPQKINTWSNGNNITNILISNNLAFLSIQGLGIDIINISNPYSLARVGNWTNYKNPCNVIVKESNLFVASENYQLEILDFSNFSNVIKIGECEITNKPYKMLLRDDLIYIANGIEGLKIINIGDITNPNLVSTFNQDSSITNILIEENYVFLINNSFGLSILDAIDPNKHLLPNIVLLNEKITAIEIYGEYIYLGCESNGLQVLKFSEFITTKNTHNFSPNINAQNIMIDDDNRLYLCAIEDGVYDGGLFIFNISNPSHPQYLGNFSKLGLDFYDIEILDEICYAATYAHGLITLNVSDPSNIKILDSISGYFLNFSQSIDIVDNFAFVANGLIGLDVYDISDPLNLQFITNYPGDFSNGDYSHIKIRNNFAFIAKGYEGIEVLNVTNINNIHSIVNYTDSYNNSVALDFWGDFLLVADRFDGLEIFNITDVKNLQKIASYTDSYSRTVNVKVMDNLAIISDRNDGIEIINISDPLNPEEILSYSDDYNNSWGCAFTSRFSYVADARDGLQVIQYKEHLFNQYEETAIAQSLEIDKTIATITNATLVINAEVPTGSSIQIFLSNNNGNNWDSVTNDTFHSFGNIGSELIWKIIISTNNDLVSPQIFNILIDYSAINTPPEILNQNELQNLAIWNQPEDFVFFEIDLSPYKFDNEFSAEYLYWSIENLNYSIVSFVQDGLNKDVFRFYSINNIYGNDEFNLRLEDEAGESVSLNISLNIYSINDPPSFIENDVNIQQDVVNELLTINYTAADVDNLLSDLNYSIFYGSNNNWHPIIENNKELTYRWDTKNVAAGNYYIKIIVSDGLDNSTWISAISYPIIHPTDSSLVDIIILSLIFSGVIGLGIFTTLVILKARKRGKPFFPVKE